MGAHISRRLSNSFEGALAGGGDPATSPLYVFGPFLKLVVLAGVAQITFGATLWLAVFTVVMVSAMYRQVMIWVTDGSGGSGLSEEEFGGWAVKINAGITVIEYTLTFLVSMAALVTFIADRAPVLNQSPFGIQNRTFLAVALSLVTVWLVNRGPKVSARVFGPATAAVLLLLWVMIFAAIWKFGFRLPDFNLQAFKPEYLNFTLGGYARILALMTGIEIFANLVAAYDGTLKEKSRKAFRSLIIIMGTTSVTMLIVGPAIFSLSDSHNEHISVFTQTMDQLLPAWASYSGTLIGIAVLLSASAASAQGVQNLALGLRYRHYIAAPLGQRNKHDVADKPVWIQAIIVSFCFFVFGTQEDTYLALYAAGVFILLSMTGWAATKRLRREMRGNFRSIKTVSLIGTIIAALLTTAATLIIFEERFFEGAWIYLLLVPGLYLIFTYYRNRLGIPTLIEERLGLLTSEKRCLSLVLQYITGDEIAFKKILIPLDGSALSEQALPIARAMSHAFDAELNLIAVDEEVKTKERREANQGELTEYLQDAVSLLRADNIKVEKIVRYGEVAAEIEKAAKETETDLIVMSTRGSFELGHLFTNSVARKMLEITTIPTLLIRPMDNWRNRHSQFKRLLVALDGSDAAEQVLPYIRTFARCFQSEVLLLSVPEGSESEIYHTTIKQYMEDIAAALVNEGFETRALIMGSGPARTILAVSEEENIDLIMMASHGRGGVERAEHVKMGSVADRVIQDTLCPVFLLPLKKLDGVSKVIGE